MEILSYSGISNRIEQKMHLGILGLEITLAWSRHWFSVSYLLSYNWKCQNPCALTISNAKKYQECPNDIHDCVHVYQHLRRLSDSHTLCCNTIYLWSSSNISILIYLWSSSCISSAFSVLFRPGNPWALNISQPLPTLQIGSGQPRVKFNLVFQGKPRGCSRRSKRSRTVKKIEDRVLLLAHYGLSLRHWVLVATRPQSQGRRSQAIVP